VRRALFCVVILATTPHTALAAAEDELVLGMSAAFSGASQGIGIELYRGAQAYFDGLNERGGIDGLHVVIRALDDGYDPDLAVANSRALLEDDQVVALFNFVGTPTVTRMLPLLKLFGAPSDGAALIMPQQPVLFFAYTGAQPLRTPPYGEHVFNLRASYRDETEAIVRQLAAIGRTRIGVFLQADAYGRSGWDGVRRTARRYGAKLVGEATYRRGAAAEESYVRQVEILRSAGADAVVVVGSYAAAAGFIRDARDQGWKVPIATLSFAASENLLQLLTRAEAARGVDYTQGLIQAQVVPSYDDQELSAVREYRKDMLRYPYRPAPAFADSSYQPMPASAASLEGYLNAKLMAEILARALRTQSLGNLRAAAEGLSEVELGIGAPVGFSREDHEGLKQVYFTRVRNGRTVPLQDWSEFAP
jgi:ABC-type branched-subunit amino acid transport system substrate-binding protein